MREVWTTKAVRAAEDRLLARTRPGALMRTASFGLSVHAARLIAELSGGVSGSRIALLVGAGNNGGDALWAGAFLRKRGARVTAVLLDPERVHAEGLAAVRRAGGRVVAGTDRDAGTVLGEADLVLDGIVGLRAHGGLRPAAAALVQAVHAPVLAVDLPSGVDPDTGEVNGPAVTAHTTVTFGAYKPLHVLAPGAARCGRVHLVDIGLEPELGEPDLVLLDVEDVGRAWPVPGPEDDKYSQGVVGVAAGSAAYPGAAVLSTGAATLAASGLVRFAGEVADVVRAQWPEVVATGSVADAGRVQAWVVGPGLGTGFAARDVVSHVLAAGVPVCADADALNVLSANPELWDARDPGTPLVLTPHAGEFARLVDDSGDRVSAVRRAAAKLDAVVLLKGHSTLVAAPDGRVLVGYSGRSWPATAGSGDVLSGIIGALLAKGLDPWLAAGCGAYVHDLAAELAADGAPIPASSILHAVPDAVRAVRSAAIVRR